MPLSGGGFEGKNVLSGLQRAGFAGHAQGFHDEAVAGAGPLKCLADSGQRYAGLLGHARDLAVRQELGEAFGFWVGLHLATFG